MEYVAGIRWYEARIANCTRRLAKNHRARQMTNRASARSRTLMQRRAGQARSWDITAKPERLPAFMGAIRSHACGDAGARRIAARRGILSRLEPTSRPPQTGAA